MKKIFIVIPAILISTMAFSQGINFQKDKYKDILKRAKKENKAVFIDIYTSWCAPCKLLSKNIFPLEKVGKKYNDNFISIKLDAENDVDGKFVASKFGVNAYPTLLFVSGKGELVYKEQGSKDEYGMIKLADAALKAYDALPSLNKMNKKYRKGERSKEFLNDYYNIRNASGLDCGDLLIEYFALLSDEEILEKNNYSKISKITIYNKELTSQLIELGIKVSKLKKLDEKSLYAINNNIGKHLGNCLSYAAKNKSDIQFHEILEHKKRYFTIPGNINSVTKATMGGGNLYIPSELLCLEFYAMMKNADKFINTMDSYIAEIESGIEAKQAKNKLAYDEINAKMEAAKNNGDMETYNSIKGSLGFIAVFMTADDYYISVQLMNQVSTYIEFFKGIKDTEFDDKIVRWYQLISAMHISCQTAPFIAGKLIEMKHNKEAKIILKEAISYGQSAANVNKVDIDKCIEMLTKFNL